MGRLPNVRRIRLPCPRRVGLHELIPRIPDRLLAGLVERGCCTSTAAATTSAARRSSAAHTAAARLGVFLEHTAHHHEVVLRTGNGVERLEPAEHVECSRRLPACQRSNAAA